MLDCVVSGTVYDAENNAKANAVLTIVPLGVTGALMHSASFTATSNASGVVTFTCAQGAQYTIKGNVLGYTGDGLTVTMPASSTVTLESLTASSLVPSTGLTIKVNGSAFASLIGILDLSSDFTVTESPTGEVNISIAAESLVNPMSAVGDSIYGGASGAATRLAGNTTTTRKFLRQTGDGAASAAPAWDTLQAVDIPSLAATYSVLAHNHSGVYEAANANIQSHISSTSNPHGVTKSQVGLGSVDNVQQMPLSYLDTDTSLTANSDVKVPSQKAVKAYVDASGGGGGATPALDNLAAVAINTSLISDTDNTDDLGSALKMWKDGYFKGRVCTGTGTGVSALGLKVGDTSGLWERGSGYLAFITNNNQFAELNVGGIFVEPTKKLGWYSSGNPGAPDSHFIRLSDGVVGVKDSADAYGDVRVEKVLDLNGVQVVTTRGAAVTDPTGGATVDAEARAAIVAILDRLGHTAGHGLITR